MPNVIEVVFETGVVLAAAIATGAFVWFMMNAIVWLATT